MIEEFIQGLRKSEAEASSEVEAARVKAQAIRDDAASKISEIRVDSQKALQIQFDLIDQEAKRGASLEEVRFHQELQKQLRTLDDCALRRKKIVVDSLIHQLTS